MRKIKFRAWSEARKEYIDSGVDGHPDFAIMPRGEVIFRVGGLEFDYDEHDLRPEEVIIEQFTGLHDKNGREIYEGDIVEYKEYEYDDKSEVFRDVVTMSRFPVFWLEKEETGYEGECLVDHEYTKVIGNIHENPELLK